MRVSADRAMRNRARVLRATMTIAERKLWKHLRGKQLNGAHFRRQAPFGKYIVDFVCHQHRLIIEIEGGQHGLPKNIAQDRERTAFFEREGYRVLRFWNNEVTQNMLGVATTIRNALENR